MKSFFKTLQFTIIAVFSVFAVTAYGQMRTDGQSGPQTDAPKNAVTVEQGTPQPLELNAGKNVVNTPDYVQQWAKDLQKARWEGDVTKARMLQMKVDDYYNVKETDNNNIPLDKPIASQVVNSPEMPLGDWYGSDVTVYTGGLRSDGFRQLALTNGDDGNLYAVINTSLSNSTTRLYRSTNHGVTWSNIGQVTYGTNYAQSVNISYADSGAVNRITLIICYGSQAPPTRNASVWYVSWRANGSYAQVSLVQSPPSGQGFRDASIITDGLYYAPGVTYFYGTYVAVNSSGVGQAIYVCRSISFGTSWTTYPTVDPGWNDQYPVIDYKQILGGAESLYVVTSRVFSSTSAGIRIHKNSYSNMGSGWSTVYLTSANYYSKQDFGIRHTNSNATNNQMLITCSKDNNGVYHFSQNAGASWLLDYNLAFGTENPVTFTACTLDSQAAGNNYAKAVFISNGDSVIYRGGYLGSLGARVKVNNHTNTGVVVPDVSSYRQGGNTCGDVIYGGYGPTNVYYDGECLITGIASTGGEIPAVYNLNQNYPNPFNPSTSIRFSTPISGVVELAVYDISGKLVSRLVNGYKAAGTYTVDFNAARLASGVYFYKLTAGEFSDTKKMVLVK
jgi:Secretion system C-terminal sorting domain